jgi:hypothetical protein
MTLNTFGLIIGFVMVVWGAYQIWWGTREAGGLPSEVGQGLGMLELGVAFVAYSALPPGILRTTIVVVFVLASMWTHAANHRARRQARE